MGGILGKGGDIGSEVGYVGCSYKVTPPPTGEELKAYAKEVRREMGIDLVGRQAVELTEAEEES